MNFELAPRQFACLIVLTAAILPASAAESKQPSRGKMVDSGSFGVFVNGKRVATETFTIEQVGDGSLTKSEFKAEAGETKAVQTSELQLSSSGDVRRYTWNELSPGKAQATVEPQQDLLVQRLVTGPTEKPIEQPYLLRASTVILDDYFFSQRELLVWRYLGAGCHPAPGQAQCKLSRTEFPALVPRQHTSLLVSMEYIGTEMVTVRGSQRQLNRFKLTAEGVDWTLWLDQNYKLIRISIAGDKTEVLRD
jgi:hypothetical protein